MSIKYELLAHANMEAAKKLIETAEYYLIKAQQDGPQEYIFKEIEQLKSAGIIKEEQPSVIEVEKPWYSNGFGWIFNSKLAGK